MLDTVESVHVTVDGLRQLESTIFRSGGALAPRPTSSPISPTRPPF